MIVSPCNWMTIKMSLVNVHPNTTITSYSSPKLNNEGNQHFCTVIAYIRLTTVLLLRAGYVLIQIGSIPVNNVHSIILQNILDITISMCSYGLVGHIFSFGNDSLGGFIGSSASLKATNLDSIIFGFSACLLGSNIVTTMLSGRVLPMSITVSSFFHSGLLQPIVMHWIWHERGWMARKKLHNIKFAIKDHAGAIAVHLPSATTALCASICLGRRLIKLKGIHESSLGVASPATVFIGYIFVIVGMVSFSLPTQKYELGRIPDDFIGIILINSVMAVASSIFVIMMQCFCFGHVSGYWTLLKYMQGCLAGLVVISSGIDIYDHIVAFLIATFGGITFYCVSIVSERIFYEDYCNVVPIYLWCAVIGSIFPPIFGSKEHLGNSIHFHLRMYHVLWQAGCALVVIIWSTVISLPLFLFLQAMGLLANKNEELNHQRSLNAVRNMGDTGSVWRIFTSNEETCFIEPGSERIKKTLEILKEQNEARREYLGTILEKKQKKTKNSTGDPKAVPSPLIPAEKIVKNMGILDSERYPASYDDFADERLSRIRFIQTEEPTELLKTQEISNSSTDETTPKIRIEKKRRRRRNREFKRIRKTIPNKKPLEDENPTGGLFG